MVIVHCTSDRITPVVFWNDGTNSVQTYCELEIVIMTMKPRRSWIQRALLPAASESRSIVPNVSVCAMTYAARCSIPVQSFCHKRDKSARGQASPGRIFVMGARSTLRRYSPWRANLRHFARLLGGKSGEHAR